MKVLQITAAYKPAYVYGGPTMSVSELSEQLQVAGCDIQVFATTANGTEELNVTPGKPLLVDGVPVTYFTRLTKDHSHFSPALLKALWRRVTNYDIVHIHAWWNLVSVLSCLIALWRRVPVVVSPRGTLSTYSFQHRNSLIKTVVHKLINRPLLKKCYIHATSATEAEDIIQLVKPAGIFTLPNFVKLPPQMAASKTPRQSQLRVLFYSRLDKKKGLELLLNALPLLRIPYQLTIAGSGDEEYTGQLKKIAQENQSDRYITWAGFQSQHKFELLQRHDILVLPSYNENFGNVVIESLSVGTAVLVSRFVGLADYVNQHQLGWTCDTDSTSIAREIEAIYTKREQINEICLRAPALIYNDFTGSTLANKYISHYKQMIPHGSV